MPKRLAELSFEEAENSFKTFLDGKGFGSRLHWVFREDVIIVGGGIEFVRTPIPADNRERARECFELGKRRDLGMAFHAFGILDGVPCAYISLPKDDMDAQYKMMGNHNLKLGHTKEMPEARETASFILWKLRQVAAKYGRVVRWDKDVPSRKTLLPV